MAKTEFKYDIFISYSHKDEVLADTVLRQRLDDAGLKVCIDYRDFEAGKMALLNMQDAVKESKHVVLVLTQNWLDSEWSLFEALVGGTKDPAGLQKKLIPLLYEDGIQNDINDFIAMRTWVDFTRKDREDIAWKQLFTALGKPEAFQPSNLKPETPSRDTWNLAHPYPMPPNFTGRVAEQQMLDNWLADNTNRLFILRALGGFGKSALAWQWINTHVNPAKWTKLVWWSFYEGDASFEHFIEETLKYLKLEVPQGGRPQVDALLDAMQSQKILLIMDGFERVLRLYESMNAPYQSDEEQHIVENELDCKDINAEWFLKGVCARPNIKSKILMTTRLTPRIVKPRGEFMLGCKEEELTSMQPADVVEFFHKQGIKGTHAEIEAACTPYGYHPLSLRLLAGRILKDFENPADIVVAQKLKIDGDIIQQKHHVLEVSYNSLPKHEQKLLSTIACFRSLVELKTLEAINEENKSLQDELRDLAERGLLHFDDKNKKFDLHPIVRRFAYDRLTAHQRTDAHVVLVVYFEAVPQPQKIEKLEDLAPVIELYHHLVGAEKYTEAEVLFYERLRTPLYIQFGAYQTIIELLRTLFLNGENELPTPDTDDKKSFTLNELANSYSLSGQPRRAVPLFEMQIAMREKQGAKKSVATGLGNMAIQAQLPLGALSAAERNFRRGIDLCRETQDEFGEAVLHQELGFALSYRGAWQEAEQELDKGLELFLKVRSTKDWISKHWAYRSQLAALTMRQIDAIKFAQDALNFSIQDAAENGDFPGDFIRDYWSLGAAYRLNTEWDKADENLSKAITMCRQINSVIDEADILLDLARLRYDQKNYEEAKSLADEALLITERCGYVLQGADVNLFLAQYALEQEKDKVKAKAYAEEALKLATCDGPPYYYKVAYDEAVTMLERLKV